MAQMSIPKYFLYGEPVRDVEERFIHIESITERIPLVGWESRPHSHGDLHHLFMITAGGGVLHADAERYSFTESSLVCVPFCCVHSIEFRPDTTGWALTLSNNLLGSIIHTYPELSRAFARAGEIHLGRASGSPRDAESLRQLFSTAANEFGGGAAGWRPAIESCAVAILVFVLRLDVAAEQLAVSPHSDRDASLVERFRRLIDANFREQIGITEYARRLCVSQERLRLACTRITGPSPIAMLNTRRILEAKRELLYTNMTVAQIALDCGFGDPAYFSRHFAQRTGESPSSFRLRRCSNDRPHSFRA